MASADRLDLERRLSRVETLVEVMHQEIARRPQHVPPPPPQSFLDRLGYNTLSRHLIIAIIAIATISAGYQEIAVKLLSGMQ